MFTADVIGHWLAIFITIATLSYLYEDNPIYKLVEHVFVGTSIGYVMVRQVRDTIVPNLIDRLSGEAPTPARIYYVVPLVLVLFLFARYVPRFAWLGRIPIAFVIGVYAGQNIPAFANANLLVQLASTLDDVQRFAAGTAESAYPAWATALGLVVLVVGMAASLVYFFFSIEHKGPIAHFARFGVWILMIGFGASFGYTVQGRISLAIGRAVESLGIGLPEDAAARYHSKPVSVIAIVVVFGTIAWMKRKRPAE